MSNTQNKQKTQTAEAKQQDLIDLPEQAPQSPWKQFLMTPKFLLLLFVSLFFIGRNIYIEYTKDPKVLTQEQQKNVAKQEISPELYNRFFWYIALTIIFFGFYIFLRRRNDAADQEQIRQQVRKQQQEAIKKKKIEQKANKIITSMDQFGNVIDESAFKKKQEPKDSSQQSKKDQ